MINLDGFRNNILASLVLKKYEFHDVVGKEKIKDVNKVNILNNYFDVTNSCYNLKNIFFVNQSEITEVSLELTRIGKTREAIEVSLEIEDPEYLY